MNWTGGKLNRYVRRNVKVTDLQKKHFAKVSICYRIAARALELDGPDPSVPISPLNRDEKYESQIKCHASKLTEHAGSRAPPIEFDQAQMLVAHPSKASSGEFTIQSTMSAQPLTGEDIPSSGLEPRTKLLKRSDWLELSLFRPLKFEFPSADEKAQIGRRRRMSRRKKNQLSDAKILNLTSQLGKRKRSLQQTASAHSLIQSTQNDKRTKSHIPTTPNKSSTSSQRLNTSNADPNIRADVESFLLLSDPERSAYYLEESDFSGCEIREILMDLPSLQVLTASGVTSFDDLQVPSHELEQCLSLTLVEIVAHQSPRTRNACLQDSKSAKSSPFASDLQQEKSSSLPESSNSKLSHLDLKEAEE